MRAPDRRRERRLQRFAYPDRLWSSPSFLNLTLVCIYSCISAPLLGASLLTCVSSLCYVLFSSCPPTSILRSPPQLSPFRHLRHLLSQEAFKFKTTLQINNNFVLILAVFVGSLGVGGEVLVDAAGLARAVVVGGVAALADVALIDLAPGRRRLADDTVCRVVVLAGLAPRCARLVEDVPPAAYALLVTLVVALAAAVARRRLLGAA